MNNREFHEENNLILRPMSDSDSIDEEEIENTKTHVVASEDDLVAALGIKMMNHNKSDTAGGEDVPTASEHIVVPDPNADEVDLSDLRGTRAPTTAAERMMSMLESAEDDDLEALAELVPQLKSGKEGDNHTMTVEVSNKEVSYREVPPDVEATPSSLPLDSSAIEVSPRKVETKESMRVNASIRSPKGGSLGELKFDDSMKVQDASREFGDKIESKITKFPSIKEASASNASPAMQYQQEDHDLGGFDDVDSENAIEDNNQDDFPSSLPPNLLPNVPKLPSAEPYATHISSAASLSTATQTHEVRMPMYLPTFKPATGCTNASDFIVRCFVARLRSGITVVKHGRSRWCKSRLRILHIHPDGRSLSWKPAVGEPTSSKRPPKLDLSTCMEVRHAWSPDPLNPMFTGTPILRQKCEAANAHKSFALIFPKRTVDITAVTADQCKVLMEGFSALCFRLQVASLAGRGGSKKGKEDDVEVATTASVTLTNNSSSLQSPSVGGRSHKRAK